MTHAIFVELLGGIGDLIFALPALDALSRNHPTTEWDVLTFAPGGELLIGDPRVHEVFFARPTHAASPTNAEERLRPGHPPCWHDLANLLSTRHYDLVVSDSRHSGIDALIEASDVPRAVTQLWSRTHSDEPIFELFLRRLREEGLVEANTPNRPPRVWLKESEQRSATVIWTALGVAPERVVVLNPHAGMAIKRWPTASFVAIGSALSRIGWDVVVLEGDASINAPAITREIRGARLLPRLSLRETAACLSQVALVISGDTGIAHLTRAVGRPVVAIFGPTWFGRYGVAAPARNLQSPFDCPELNPMNFTEQRCWFSGQCLVPGKQTCCSDIRPEDVLAAARTLLPLTDSAGIRAERRSDPVWAL